MDGQLVKESNPDYSLSFVYDNAGNLAKFIYEADTQIYEYFVTCNLRGDVEAIYLSSGILASRYISDAWGNVQ